MEGGSTPNRSGAITSHCLSYLLGYREIGCASVALYDQDGQRLNTVRYGRMPECKKTILRQQLTAECQHILHQAPLLKGVKLADGAPDNWDYLSQLDLGLPLSALANLEQMEIVDFSHAAVMPFGLTTLTKAKPI